MKTKQCIDCPFLFSRSQIGFATGVYWYCTRNHEVMPIKQIQICDKANGGNGGVHFTV